MAQIWPYKFIANQKKLVRTDLYATGKFSELTVNMQFAIKRYSRSNVGRYERCIGQDESISSLPFSVLIDSTHDLNCKRMHP